MDPPHLEPPAADSGRQQGRFRWVKWLLGAALIALLAVEAIELWPTLSDSWRALTELHWGWAAAKSWMTAPYMPF